MWAINKYQLSITTPSCSSGVQYNIINQDMKIYEVQKNERKRYVYIVGEEEGRTATASITL